MIGIGINLAISEGEFPDDIRWPATSLGHDVTPERMRTALDAALTKWVAEPSEHVVEVFTARDALRGRELEWDGGPGDGGRSGTGEGIDERGNLLVRTGDDELVALGSGEVSLRLS